MASTLHALFQGELPAGRLRAWAGYWDLRRGDHPSLAGHLASELLNLPPFPSAEEYQAITQLDLPLSLPGGGHHLVRDAGYAHAAGRSDEYPLAPLFVRDLAGRVIHTGLLPLPTPPEKPLFPAGCQDVPATLGGAELIENALFLSFRCVDVSPSQGIALAGQPGLHLRAAVASPSACSYKIRPDTFYQDGWRLPQVERLFARAVPGADVAAAEFIATWQNRPAGQDYESFYEQNNGAQWFEGLFLKGVTVIPTLEAYNGHYHVGDDYTVQDVDPGRAVPGLHEVMGSEDSTLPQGTILQVIKPGYITAAEVHKAEVVVSNGSGHQPPEGPVAFIPDLHLPHPRVSAEWGKVWVPTHPSHFAAPALWDWNGSGHFVQVSGPLWDPLHYTYASVPAMVRAVRRQKEDNPGAFELPPSFRTRFHPVVVQTWYDTVDERTLQERAEKPGHPLQGSALDQVALMKPVATVGYHALPTALEYELDPAVFPEIHPFHQGGACPVELENRVAEEAKLIPGREELRALHVVMREPLRALLMQAEEQEAQSWFYGKAEAVRPKSGSPATPAALQLKLAPAFLPDMPSSHLLINVKRLFANRGYRQGLQKQSVGLAAALFRFREEGLAWRRLRYRLFSKYPAVWVQAWATGIGLLSAEKWVPEKTPEEHEAVYQARAGSLAVEVPVPKALPAMVAGGLPLAGKASKLKKALKNQSKSY